MNKNSNGCFKKVAQCCHFFSLKRSAGAGRKVIEGHCPRRLSSRAPGCSPWGSYQRQPGEVAFEGKQVEMTKANQKDFFKSKQPLSVKQSFALSQDDALHWSYFKPLSPSLTGKLKTLIYFYIPEWYKIPGSTEYDSKSAGTLHCFFAKSKFFPCGCRNGCPKPQKFITGLVHPVQQPIAAGRFHLRLIAPQT